MASIFTIDNTENFSEQINIDELYDKKQKHDLIKLELFNKILNRVHVRIKTTSHQKLNDHHCWFVVPEVIIGVAKYDHAACIAYIIDKLQNNGFRVKYIHPNTLFIYWGHFIPSYVRNEYKRKTGIVVDEFGEVVKTKEDEITTTLSSSSTVNDNQKSNFNVVKTDSNKREYNSIKSYKPSGQLIYNNSMTEKFS
jgi:hypothetical protein